MNKRLLNFAKSAFLLTISVYVLALPVYALTHAGDFLLPYEAALCTSLSIVGFGWSGYYAKETIKN